MAKIRTVALVVLGLAARLMAASGQVTDLQWFACPEHSDLSCAYFDIPLDYHNASAGNGRLLVVKANATTERKGTIFLNPGGPGVSGLQTLADDGDALRERSGGAYDFISWDARGIGPYTYPGNVYCIPDGEYASFWNGTLEVTGINQLGNFTNQTDLDAFYAQAPIMDAKWQELGERCLQGPNGTTLRYIGTAATVRDLVGLADAIVGSDSQINYWGLSYGTLIGAWFINMFPERVGHVILDGLWRDQVTSPEDVYTALANSCAMAGANECKLATFQGASGADVVQHISEAIELAHDHPVKNNLLMLRATLYGGLYQPQLWSTYANQYIPSAIDNIHNSSGVALQRRDGKLNKRDTFSQNSYTEAAVVCADSVDADPLLTMRDIFDDIVNITQTVSPTFGALFPVPWHRCSYWPVRAPERYQGPFNHTFANKVLVIGNSYDGATPFTEAQHMAEILGDQAALVKQDGFGHTTLYQSSACVTNVITSYLNDGTLPSGTASAPTVCAIDDSVEIFPGVRSVDVKVNATDISNRV